MAKSKQQKREEAIERMRAQFPLKRERYIDNCVGGNGYVRVLNLHGLAAAEDLAKRSHQEWGRYLKDAGLTNAGVKRNKVDPTPLQSRGIILKGREDNGPHDYTLSDEMNDLTD